MANIAVSVKNLTFSYASRTEDGARRKVLDDITLEIPKKSRVLLVGGNGAGKSTLLRIFAGKHMHKEDAVTVLGKSAFFETPKGLTYLGSEWRRTVAFTSYAVRYHADIPVRELLEQRQCDEKRKEKLLALLGIDLDWRMHELSDGETRRVQILMGLLEPFELLLIDEITVDLDVLMRVQLLDFLSTECEERGATVMYATHIFDGLSKWPTHIIRLNRTGKLTVVDPKSLTKELYLTVADWLLEDKQTLGPKFVPKAVENTSDDPSIRDPWILK